MKENNQYLRQILKFKLRLKCRNHPKANKTRLYKRSLQGKTQIKSIMQELNQLGIITDII